MSHYATFQVQFRDLSCIKSAMLALGFKDEEINTNAHQSEAVDYYGNRSGAIPVLSVSRAAVQRLSKSHCYNSIVFAEDGKGGYKLLLDNYDQRSLTRALGEEVLVAIKRQYNLALLPKIAHRLRLSMSPAKRVGKTVQVVGVQG